MRNRATADQWCAPGGCRACEDGFGAPTRRRRSATWWPTDEPGSMCRMRIALRCRIAWLESDDASGGSGKTMFRTGAPQGMVLRAGIGVRARICERVLISVVGERVKRKILPAMAHKQAIQAFDAGAIAGGVAHQVVDARADRRGFEADFRIGGEHFLDGAAVIELILNPFQQVDGGP